MCSCEVKRARGRLLLSSTKRQDDMWFVGLTVVPALLTTSFFTATFAHADAAMFPQIDNYATVDVADYSLNASTPGITIAQVFFKTPDGIDCDFVTGQAQCTGNNFPGIPPATPTSKGTPRINWIGTTTGLQQTVPSTAPPTGVRPLPPQHSITVNGIICGVDNSGTTACKDPQGRGFVLSPQGSAWLPHV